MDVMATSSFAFPLTQSDLLILLWRSKSSSVIRGSKYEWLHSHPLYQATKQNLIKRIINVTEPSPAMCHIHEHHHTTEYVLVVEQLKTCSASYYCLDNFPLRTVKVFGSITNSDYSHSITGS